MDKPGLRGAPHDRTPHREAASPLPGGLPGLAPSSAVPPLWLDPLPNHRHGKCDARHEVAQKERNVVRRRPVAELPVSGRLLPSPAPRFVPRTAGGLVLALRPPADFTRAPHGTGERWERQKVTLVSACSWRCLGRAAADGLPLPGHRPPALPAGLRATSTGPSRPGGGEGPLYLNVP